MVELAGRNPPGLFWGSGMNEQCFLLNGRMAYQMERPAGCNSVMISRAVHQPDGTWWKYDFYKGAHSVGVPLRGKTRQGEIEAFVAKVKAALADQEKAA